MSLAHTLHPRTRVTNSSQSHKLLRVGRCIAIRHQSAAHFAAVKTGVVEFSERIQECEATYTRIEIRITLMARGAMIRENRPLVKDEPVEFEKGLVEVQGKFPIILEKIYRIYPQFNKRENGGCQHVTGVGLANIRISTD
jgi:hypothetical protein